MLHSRLCWRAHTATLLLCNKILQVWMCLPTPPLFLLKCASDLLLLLGRSQFDVQLDSNHDQTSVNSAACLHVWFRLIPAGVYNIAGN